ncbi:hypothetical protein CPB97_011437 [Podila verticillata]|nr:hypothetical protein CPB97_011437 [Podila verticillata]
MQQRYTGSSAVRADSLRIMREYERCLSSILENFIHDLLAEWDTQDSRPYVYMVRRRILGSSSLGQAVLVSVEEQAAAQIDKPTDNENLAEMGVGWGPMV